MKKAIYPGSFDPLTLGHLDIIERASRMYDHLYVTIFDNPTKKTMFSLAERLELLQAVTASFENVSVDYSSALAVEYAKELGKNIPIVLHLDHGDTFELCKNCIDSGFSSVMIDGSHHSYEDNIALTKKVVEYAHAHGVTVEGELGVLAGVEDDVVAEHHTYTRPEEVVDFVTRTGVDSLAISIGTSHGANKFTPAQCTRDENGILIPPPLRFDILEEIEKQIPGFPIVLHGASSVPQEYVETINKYGGKLVDSIGIPEDQLRKAAASAVCKINIDSDGRLAMTAAVREVFATKPGEFDARKYLGPARDELKKLYSHKTVSVLGSAGKA
jgi:fructose-bisphosphate aldolase class II